MDPITPFFSPNSTLGVTSDQDEPDSGISFYFSYYSHIQNIEDCNSFQFINKNHLSSK